LNAGIIHLQAIAAALWDVSGRAFMAAPLLYIMWFGAIFALSAAVHEGLEQRGFSTACWALAAGCLFGLACALPAPPPLVIAGAAP
jgi:hypothetical protein